MSTLKLEYSPTSEDVAYWFFRLNGCLTIQNFLVHPVRRGPQLTDADLLALRFPWRQERNMIDHRLFEDRVRPSLLLVEVKSAGPCRLNGPWTNPQAGNLIHVLSAVGCFKETEIKRAANALYGPGAYRGRSVDASLVAVAEYRSAQLEDSAPKAEQVLWDEILQFIFDRFRQFRAQKAHHPQWDPAGQRLYELAEEAHGDGDHFKEGVREAFFR